MNTATKEDKSVTRDGSLFIVEDACAYSGDRRSGRIVVASDNRNFGDAITELLSMKARNLAMSYAATQGIGNVCLNGNTLGPYPVNMNGVALDQVPQINGMPLENTHPEMQPAGYRIEVPVCSKL